MIDLRSDTVTMPTDEMREAAKNAIVGDDVYGDDPTVTELEELAAKMLGMESAMFVPSGTFGNQVSLLTHTNQGDEIIIAKDSHLVAHEGGGAAIIASVMMKILSTEKGMMSYDEIKNAIREDDIHYPKTGLIWLENAVGTGDVLPLEYLKEINTIAKERGVKIHMDGARVFNAAVSLGVDVKEITKYVDSIQVCLSKGLCAPVGSVVAGTKLFVDKARWYRKMMGGGLRQAGILAAPGIIALEKMTKRLHIDHENAKYLAIKLDEIYCVNVKMDRLDINMVFFTIDEDIISSADFVEKLQNMKIKSNGSEGGEYRFVTSNDITKSDVDYVVKAIKSMLEK